MMMTRYSVRKIANIANSILKLLFILGVFSVLIFLCWLVISLADVDDIYAQGPAEQTVDLRYVGFDTVTLADGSTHWIAALYDDDFPMQSSPALIRSSSVTFHRALSCPNDGFAGVYVQSDTATAFTINNDTHQNESAGGAGSYQQLVASVSGDWGLSVASTDGEEFVFKNAFFSNVISPTFDITSTINTTPTQNLLNAVVDQTPMDWTSPAMSLYGDYVVLEVAGDDITITWPDGSNTTVSTGGYYRDIVNVQWVDGSVRVQSPNHTLVGSLKIRRYPASEKFASCISIAPPPTNNCPTLANADFTTTDAWTLNGTAAISNALHLPSPGDTATQPITITPGVYSVVISATGATVSNTLIVGMAEASATVPITNTPLWYIGTVLSTSTTGNTNFWLKNTAGDIDVGYICFSASTLNPSGGYNTCLTNLLKNGEFNGPDNWDWFNGASYNDTGGNAWLPYVISGTVQNMAVSGVRQFLSASPPAIGENERLVLQFDVRSPLDDATISARYWGVGVSSTVNMTYTVSANRNYTRYQTDFSQFADFNGWVGVGFLNTSYMYSQTEGAFVDNVCLMLTTDPITTTQPVNDYVSLPFNCASVSYWLSDTLHINFPALEAMEAPSIWDVDQWVPWLASRLWVNAGKPLACIMIALFSSGSGLAILNFFDWAIRQPAIIFAWFGGWFNLFLADMGLWLLWFSGPVGRLFLFLYEMTRNSNTALGWLGAVVGWLWDALKLLLYWQFGMFINRMMTILNTLISAWNLIAPALATLWSGMVEIFVGVWNDWLVPFLSKFGAIGEFIIMAVNNIGLLGDLAAAFFAVVWQLALMVWGFITGVSELPIRFYFAFDNAVTGSAFQLIPNCAGDMANNWCRILFGLDVVNQAIAHSVVYPMVIVGVVVTTIIIFWRHIWELLSVRFG